MKTGQNAVFVQRSGRQITTTVEHARRPYEYPLTIITVKAPNVQQAKALQRAITAHVQRAIAAYEAAPPHGGMAGLAQLAKLVTKPFPPAAVERIAALTTT